jgi:hypothetical protein
MAFYIVTKVVGPVLATVTGNVAKDYTIKNTETGVQKTYHVEVPDYSAEDPEAWLQVIEDTWSLTPNDFGL